MVRYPGLNLTWPLFVSMQNACLDPQAPWIQYQIHQTADRTVASATREYVHCLEACNAGYRDENKAGCSEVFGDEDVDLDDMQDYALCKRMLIRCYDAAVVQYVKTNLLNTTVRDNGAVEALLREPGNDRAVTAYIREHILENRNNTATEEAIVRAERRNFETLERQRGHEALRAPRVYAEAVNTMDCCDPDYVSVRLQDYETKQHAIERAVEVLRRCGYVSLPQLIDSATAVAAGQHTLNSLYDYEYFKYHYYGHIDDSEMYFRQPGDITGDDDEDEEDDDEDEDEDEDDDDEEEEEDEEEDEDEEDEEEEEDAVEEEQDEDEEGADVDEVLQEKDEAQHEDKRPQEEAEEDEVEEGVEEVEAEEDVEEEAEKDEIDDEALDANYEGVWLKRKLSQLKAWHREQVLMTSEEDDEDEGGGDGSHKFVDANDLQGFGIDDILNLRGGRFEMDVPMNDPSTEQLFQEFQDSIILPLISQAWDGDDVQHIYSTLLTQSLSALKTSVVQTKHTDAHTVQDMRVQVAIHDYIPEQDGGTYVQAASHTDPVMLDMSDLFDRGVTIDLIHQNPKDNLYNVPSDVCIGYRADHVKAGDVFIYYGGTYHGGSPNISGKRRSYIDSSFHSGTNFYHRSERNGSSQGKLVKFKNRIHERCRDVGNGDDPSSPSSSSLSERQKYICALSKNTLDTTEKMRSYMNYKGTKNTDTADSGKEGPTIIAAEGDNTTNHDIASSPQCEPPRVPQVLPKE